jgi:excinuclease ABC subunit C
MKKDRMLADLPAGPGVYLIKDRSGKVIYVGKASSLRSRVSSYLIPLSGIKSSEQKRASYFHKSTYFTPKLRALLSHLAEVETVSTGSGEEALLLEDELVKKYQPRYNVLLKDDASYPYICVTVSEDYPRAFLVRGSQDPGSKYYGPYPSASSVRRTLKALHEQFQFRSCKKALDGQPKGRPCLNKDMGRCLAPCSGKISKDRYRAIIDGVCAFLEGRQAELVVSLEAEMKRAAQRLDFERAAIIRDRLYATRMVLKAPYVSPSRRDLRVAEGLSELQRALRISEPLERIEAFDCSHISGAEACGSVVVFVQGQPSKRDYRRFKLKGPEDKDEIRMMREVISRRYRRVLEEARPLPSLILVDGGKGHLSAACGVLSQLGIRDVPVIALAKAKELIFLPSRREPIIFPRYSEALYLVQRIRDEAHRFALRYHLKLRKRGLKESVLDEVELIGTRRKEALLRHFGSIDKVRKATLEELEGVGGIGPGLARRLRRALDSG